MALAFKYKYKPKIDFLSKTNLIKIAVGIIFVVAVALIFTSIYSNPQDQVTTTTTTTQAGSGCNNYYWFDDTTRTCGYKQFCGLFIYKGLMTFATLSECQAALAATTTTTVASTDMGEVAIGMDVLREVIGQKIPKIGLATELNLEISKVEVRDADGNWFTIDERNKSLDLVGFTDKVAMVGKGKLDFGKYDEIRLYVNSASIKVYSLDFNIFNRTYDMYVPNGVINVTLESFRTHEPFIVAKDKTLALTLDVDIPQSVVKEAATIENPTGYIFDPIINVSEEYVNLGSLPANFTVV